MMQEEIICKNIFKNTEREKLKKEFNKKWLEFINESEKGKTLKLK